IGEAAFALTNALKWRFNNVGIYPPETRTPASAFFPIAYLFSGRLLVKGCNAQKLAVPLLPMEIDSVCVLLRLIIGAAYLDNPAGHSFAHPKYLQYRAS